MNSQQTNSTGWTAQDEIQFKSNIKAAGPVKKTSSKLDADHVIKVLDIADWKGKNQFQARKIELIEMRRQAYKDGQTKKY